MSLAGILDQSAARGRHRFRELVDAVAVEPRLPACVETAVDSLEPGDQILASQRFECEPRSLLPVAHGVSEPDAVRYALRF